MSARKCHGCGTFFSVKASACPDCGAVYEVQARTETAPQQSHPSHRFFAPLPQREGVTEESKRIISDIRERMKSFVSQKPNKEWAKRVLDRHARGEHIFPLGLQWAREVAGQQPEREPGSDDDLEQQLADMANP